MAKFMALALALFAGLLVASISVAEVGPNCAKNPTHWKCQTTTGTTTAPTTTEPPPLPPPPPPPPSDASVFLSPSGSDSNPCTQAAPCLTFNRGYHVAAPGAVVELAGGTYSAQLIDLPAQAAPRIVFRPAAGASVTVAGTVEIRAPHVEFRDFYAYAFYSQHRDEALWWAAASDIVYRGIRTHTVSYIGSDDVLITGPSCEIGPNMRPTGPASSSEDTIFLGSYNSRPTNTTIRDCHIHDALHRGPGYEGDHSDCIQTTGIVGLVIERNRIENCDDQDLMLKDDQGPVGAVRIENNFLDVPVRGFFAVNLGNAAYTCSDINVRYNAILGSLRADGCGGGSEYVGNIAPAPPNPVVAGWILSCNWWESQAGDPGYVNRAAFDLHLLPSSPAINQGCAPSPADDIDGQARPVGAAPDRGADEAG